MQVTVQNKQVHIRSNSQSDRPTLVFLHGAGGNGSHWLGLYKALSAKANLLVVDLPGHGLSEGPAPASISAYAEWVDECLTELGVDRASLFLTGHSMGGAIAIEFALSGYAVAGLVLVSTGARLRVAPAVLEMFRGEAMPGWADAAVAAFYGHDLAPDLAELVKQDLSKTPRELFLHDFLAADAWDALQRVPELRLPVFLIGGSADSMTPPKYIDYLAANISNAQALRLAGVGHMPMIEKPAEVAAGIEDFVFHQFSEKRGAKPASMPIFKEARE